MGCDIHSFVEIKSKKGTWEKATGFKSDFYSPYDEYWSQEEFLKGDSLISCRNYDIFEILAGVRSNGNVNPISETKGLPEDVCEEIKVVSDEWDGDGHSHSWLTGKEIKEYDKSTVENIDWVDWLFEGALNQMMERSLTGDGDDIRLVFWFDN